MSLLLRSGTILTMNDRFDIVEGDVSIKGTRIAAIASNITEQHDRVIDVGGGYVLPGFIQKHIHLCQTLFRGYADDLHLMEIVGVAAEERLAEMNMLLDEARKHVAATHIDHAVVLLGDVRGNCRDPCAFDRHVAFDGVEAVVHGQDGAAAEEERHGKYDVRTFSRLPTSTAAAASTSFRPDG